MNDNETVYPAFKGAFALEWRKHTGPKRGQTKNSIHYFSRLFFSLYGCTKKAMKKNVRLSKECFARIDWACCDSKKGAQSLYNLQILLGSYKSSIYTNKSLLAPSLLLSEFNRIPLSSMLDGLPEVPCIINFWSYIDSCRCNFSPLFLPTTDFIIPFR